MGKSKIGAKIKRSQLYTFAFGKKSTQEGAEATEGGECSRIVHCNQPHMHRIKPLKYRTNYVSTTKYSFLTFLPKSLYEQFHRVANLYFLAAAILSLTPLSPFSPVSMIAPLAFVTGLSMAKEGLEDWKRYMQDSDVNSRKVSFHKEEGTFDNKEWQQVEVGDVVRVEKDCFFPADMLLLSTGYEDGICYVETMNLDGETNLKVKRALEVTLSLDEDEAFKSFTGEIKCEDPNPSLYTFVGNLEYERQTYIIEPAQILLRDSKLRNTSFVYGVVIFTGFDTKVMQNSTKSPSKRSRIEKKMDYIIYILFSVLLVVSTVTSLGFALRIKYEMPDWWYMRPDDTEDFYNPKESMLPGLSHMVTALILYGYLIPISLYVSIEVVKVLQASFINQDIQMFDDDTGIPAQARTSNLNEELGQVDTILSDKTGTLTCNQMDFLKCSIAGTAYGTRASDVERAAAQQMASEIEQEGSGSSVSSKLGKQNIELETVVTSTDGNVNKTPIKFFSFEDDRMTQGNWTKEPNPDMITLFCRILAVCHTAVPELNEETGLYTYEAESPDEGAFLVAAREFGFEFFKRTQASVFVREKYTGSGPTEREYKILNLLEFTSKRKRMTVIVRDEDGQIILMCKGADSIIFDRLAKKGKQYLEDTTRHLNKYGEAGLRTLALSYKKLEESEYSAWNNEFQKAKTSIGSDRDAMLEKVAEMMEKDLILVGATAVEDKLQSGVPQCIDKLAQAGIKLWVLTGDKMETAINIGFAVSLLREGMKQICITTLESDSKEAVTENILKQITNASQMIKLEKDPYAAFALIVDGKTLVHCLEEDMKLLFLGLAVDCASVICCRVSPKQKALVTRLVKQGTGRVTLGIGDGANDVGMIQEADIGVGISGVEGMQAVMASDFSVSQFRYLERLLVVHGHWCYKRIAQMVCYFFYKNIAFGLTLFYFEVFTGFSGQSAYHDYYMILFNVLLTSMPVISLGVLEQDVSSDVCLEFPTLYQQGARNLFFDWYRILGWMGNGVYASLVIFFLNLILFYNQAFCSDGHTSDMAILGTIMFTCIVCAVNFQISLIMTHFTWIQNVLISFSIISCFLVLIILGETTPTWSTTAYRIFSEALAPAPIYWTTLLLVTIACNLPYLAHMSLQRCFHPMDHNILQEIKYLKIDVEDQVMWKREKTKAREKTKVGFTARVDASIRNLKGRLHKKTRSLESNHAHPS